jgi:uncharacterized repeat protein (TIGR01451 family)
MLKKAAWGSSWTAVVGLTAAIAGALLLAGGAAATTVGVNIDQCANGAAGSPSSCPPGWQNGDLNGSNSFYREGDSVPFRVILTKLAPGSHALVIQYDTLQSGKHAYDYLTRYDRTVGGLDACDGVSGCSGSGASSGTIPLSDNPSVPSPFVSGADRYFTIWNADAIGTPTLGGTSDAAGQQSVTIPFTTTGSDPVVIAWAGHIANEINWGAGNAAGGISGSPYHMRVVSIDGDTTGHQDRSMKANAVAPAPPTFVTDVESASEDGGFVGTIQPGDSVTDNALLSGDNGPVSGTVSFFWCYAASGTPDCTTGGTLLSEDVTLSALGTASSDAFTPEGSGTYCFRTEYSPDGNSLYSPANETNALVQSDGNHGECFRVVGETALLSSSVGTVIHDANGAVDSALVGSTVHDVATVTGSGEGGTPTGSVTFALFSGTGCSGEPSSTETVDLADGSASSSAATVPEGGLSYRVHYNGSNVYDVSDGLCENLSSSTVTPPSTPPSTPPAATPPAPSIDLAITKAVTPSPAALGGVVTWTLIVRNNGPDSATGVKVADPLPAGVTFVSVGAGQGSCTGGAVISCDLGSLAPGAVDAILVRTTASRTGSIVNTTTDDGNEAETDTTNNTATATLVVRAPFGGGPFTPPAKFCTAVAVSPKSIFVGRLTLLTMRVSQNGKAVAGIRVRIKGSTLGIVTKRSNAKGIVKVRVSPKRAGIVGFAPVAHKRCTNPRIGVVGVFTPPVTG